MYVMYWYNYDVCIYLCMLSTFLPDILILPSTSEIFSGNEFCLVGTLGKTYIDFSSSFLNSR